MKKFAIISSYHRACGIAQYVEHLEPCLKNIPGWEVEIIPLPVSVFRSGTKYAKTVAKLEMDAIIEKIKDADVVNIQFEPGLFGVSPFDVKKRIKKMVENSKNLIITYHTVPFSNTLTFPRSVRDIIRFLKISTRTLVFKFLFNKARKKDNIINIVHTKRERYNFEMIGVPSSRIIDHPLSFISKEKKESLSYFEENNNLKKTFKLSDDSKIIGVFGFISPYKGIDTAILALKNLPENYNLLIFGALHPESLAHEQKINPYLNEIIKIISDKNNLSLSNRVIFCGAPDNESFIRYMEGCDYVVLPYQEVGQTSSGPASMALDLSKNIFLSNNRCFNELNKYAKNAFTFFDVGNHIELAQKISSSDEGITLEECKKYNELHNVEAVCADYKRAFDLLIDKSVK